jgi:hypothetical protein
MCKRLSLPSTSYLSDRAGHGGQPRAAGELRLGRHRALEAWTAGIDCLWVFTRTTNEKVETTSLRPSRITYICRMPVRRRGLRYLVVVVVVIA